MYVERDVTSWFTRLSRVSKMIAVVGPRQAGKTTFLKRMMKHNESAYLLFDDPDVRGLFNQDIKKFELQYMEGHEMVVMDEVQQCTDAGSKLKYLVDTGRKMWITSSSEILLGEKILSYLVGRISILHLYQFSIHEFLRAKGMKAFTSQTLQRNVWEHMTYGGYPQVVITSDPAIKKALLRDLLGTILLKDIANAFAIPDTAPLERLVQYLAAVNGGIMAYDAVANDLRISFRTLKKYLDALEKSYLTTEVRPFSTNPKKEITKQPKVYFVDTGIRNAITKNFNQEPNGTLFENYILNELTKMGFTPKYWRSKSKAEVDFIVEVEDAIIPIEVKIRSPSGKISRSIRSFVETYQPKMGFIVNYVSGREDVPMMEKKQINGCSIQFTDTMGLWKHLGKRDFEPRKP